MAATYLTSVLFSILLFTTVIALHLAKDSKQQLNIPSHLSRSKRSVRVVSDSLLGQYSSAAVSSDSELCSNIGGYILRKNGTTVEVAIATLFCLGVVIPESMGLGGGFFATYYQKSIDEAFALDAREVAPGAAYEDMYNGDPELSARGALSIAVPGELRGYKELYDRFGGTLTWSELIQPSIDLCENGFAVGFHFANSLQSVGSCAFENPSMSQFINPNTGDVYKEGEIITRPELGQTLRVIQTDPDALNDGTLTDDLVQDFTDLGTIITRDDLTNYAPIWSDPVKIDLSNGGYTLYSLPPPSSGGILAYILNILDNYEFTPESLYERNSSLTYQRIAEAFKYAYGKRTELGDESFVDMTQILNELTSEDYAANTYNQITDDRTFQDPAHYGVDSYAVEDHGTSSMSVVGLNGDSISVTSTVNLYFGSCLTSVSTGIVLNDEMDDFSSPNITNSFGLPPFEGNFIEPGKRPVSSMCPAVIVDSDKDVILSVGAAGGSQISSAVAWVALHNLWFGMDIKESIDSPRLHHQLFPMVLQYQDGFDQDAISDLEDIGHVTGSTSTFGSVVCGICRDQNGTLFANADGRKGGSVDGV